MVKSILSILSTILLIPSISSAQDFLNGSFEQNAGRCLINTNNAQFNTSVKYTRAYGNYRKPDIANSDCGFGNAHKGNWFVGLATNMQGDVRSEAITLELNAPMIRGNRYQLSFWVRSRTQAPSIELGVSAYDSLAGVKFHTVNPQSIHPEWTALTIRFVAPADGRYLSVHAMRSDAVAGVWLDDFSLQPVDASEPISVSKPSAVKTGASSIEIFPNPSEGLFQINVSDTIHITELTIYNMVGDPVQQITMDMSHPITSRIDLTDEVPGFYYVELTTTSGKITRRVVVTRN